MDNIIASILFLLVVTLILAFTTWRKLKAAEQLKSCVAWSVCESDGIRWNIPLWAHLKNAQAKSNIAETYKIIGDEEWAAAKEIIAKYQTELTRSYFDGRLWTLPCLDTLQSIYEITGKDYFLYMLYVYLCENENYGQHHVFRLLSNEIDNKHIVFHKMHYITYMYCKLHPSLQKNIPAWNESRLKEILEDSFSRKK